MNKTIAAMVGLGVMSTAAQGCALPDAAKFRDPIPQQGDAQLAVAGSQVSGGATTKSAQVKLSGIGGGGTDYASMYEFTRQITDGVDTGTFEIIAAIAAVTSYQPTSIDDKQATWGPGGDSLDPVNWKVVVKETGDNEFDYEVDGRPHGDTNDSDFKAIVTGHGYGHNHPSYRSGTLILTALADASTPKDGTNENVDEKSRWDASGAGRADVKMSGGDFGSTTVMASQCWGSTFAQVYYTDNVDYQPTAGSASACAFGQASFDQ